MNPSPKTLRSDNELVFFILAPIYYLVPQLES